MLDSFACNCEDHPVARRDESYITAVELAALHRKLAVEKHWHASDAVYQLFPELIQRGRGQGKKGGGGCVVPPLSK